MKEIPMQISTNARIVYVQNGEIYAKEKKNIRKIPTSDTVRGFISTFQKFIV